MEGVTMNKNRIFAIALIVAALILSVFAFFTLPEDVAVQINLSGNANRMGKIPALLVPFLITTVFSVLLFNDDGGPMEKKHLVGSVLGVLLLIIMIGVNL